MKIPLYGTMLFLVVLAIISIVIPLSQSYDATNVSSRVNITQAMPEIQTITINNGSNVDLTEGTFERVICNVTIRDYNGYNDVANVNATFYDYLNSNRTGPDDNNDHYHNDSCTLLGNFDAITGVWECGFDVFYYANNGTWTCDVQVNDTYGYNVSGQGNGTINPLFAINVTNIIDYGDMAVNDVSLTSEIVNITNFGNQYINISVYGYGGNDSILGNGLAFICDVGNISVNNERFSIADVAWASMNSLSSSSTNVPGLTIPQQTDDLQAVVNQTYWRLFVPPNPFGICNGTVVFEAQLP